MLVSSVVKLFFVLVSIMPELKFRGVHKKNTKKTWGVAVVINKINHYLETWDNPY
jgi:hypothetical protein